MSTAKPSAALRRFAGPGGLPPRRNIMVLTARLLVTSDMCLGDGTAGEAADMVVARDRATGQPILPATGQTGALRAAMARVADVSETDLDALFGAPGSPSLFRPYDAVADTPLPATGVRDGIAVDPATATVLRGHLFSAEVLSAGTTFPLVWEVHLPPDRGRAVEMLTLVATAAGVLGSGRIRFGRRTHIGFGAVTAHSWQARFFDLGTSIEDIRAWYTPALAERRRLAEARPVHPRAVEALNEALPEGFPAATEREAAPREGLSVTVTLANEEQHGERWVPAPLLVAGVHSGLDNTTTHLHRPSFGEDGSLSLQPLDSGSTTVSLFRRTAGRALAWIVSARGDRDQAAHVLRDLFGSHPADGGTLTAARLRIDEGPFTETASVTMTSVAINALAHTTLTGALTQSTAIVGGGRTVTIEVIEPVETDIAVLRLALGDLVDGVAPSSGADTATGHGRRHATAVTVHYQPTRGPARTWNTWQDFAGDPFDADCHAQLLDRLGAR